jgi:hypothetical protein
MPLPTTEEVQNSLAHRRSSMLPAVGIVFDTIHLHPFKAAEQTGLAEREVDRLRVALVKDACSALGIDYGKALLDQEVAEGKRVVLKPEEAPYTVQDRHPEKQPEWRIRYSDLSTHQASIYYSGINIGLGWQKRLLDKDGRVIIEASS